MNKILKFILSVKFILVYIFFFLAQYFYVPSLLSKYMISDNTYFVYKYAILISKSLVYIGLLLSFLYPILVWIKSKEYFKENRIIVSIVFLPALYHVVLFFLTFFFKNKSY